MAFLEKQLYVKKSTLPGAGNGLFTKKFIPKGTRIVEYKGRTRTWKEVQQDEEESPYIYYVKRNFVIDALNDKKAMARYANDARGLQRVKNINNNAEYVEDGTRVFIEAAKDIPARAEIFVGYGPEYWQVIRHNMRIDEKEKKKLLTNGTKVNGKVNGRKVNGKKVNGEAAKVNGKATKVNGRKVNGTKVNGNAVKTNGEAVKAKVNGKKRA
ncbi:SET domain-containing protein [Niastella caeni]|uniref:SET domain-containing protein n=1 Tax=Niastella caeni TaxID=2569763 RepID=A0A4S8HGM0_9BACT|nr:SET domain-containing protein [Niastella caeni]THU34177.1 SET domain-containing protein [Niastella caeni]